MVIQNLAYIVRPRQLQLQKKVLMREHTQGKIKKELNLMLIHFFEEQKMVQKKKKNVGEMRRKNFKYLFEIECRVWDGWGFPLPAI